MVQIEFKGTEQLHALARRYDRIGGDLIGGVGAAIKRSAHALAKEPPKEARRRLPQRGGLADLVGQTRMQVQVRSRRRNPGVRIVALPGAVKDPGRIDRGRVAHPVFGHRPRVFQNVRAGWFSDPMQAGAPGVRAAVRKAVHDSTRVR